MSKKVAHPYIPNSAPEQKNHMLNELGMESAEDIFKEIPKHLRFQGRMNLPEPLMSEYELRRHVEGILAKNKNCKDNISFLGGGTAQHYVPAVCDTIIGRDEFLTAYVGDAYSDHGKFQALFETASMVAELTDMEVVNTPTYDWANAISIAARMAVRKNGRKEVLVGSNMSPGRFAVLNNYLRPEVRLVKVDFNVKTGLLDLGDLRRKISDQTSAVYFENPTYLGVIEIQGEEISKIAHEHGAEVIVGADPTSLGVLAAPTQYGADFVVGDYQPLGIHMQYGGGLSGFIATRDSKEYLGEYPSLLFGITTTTSEGEYGFGEVFYERTSYASREEGKDFIGTCTALYGIVAGVYLALMGPQGMYELGEGIMQRVAYAKEELAKIDGVKLVLEGDNYKEFALNFDGTGKTVKEINDGLKSFHIFGGIDLSSTFSELGQSALYCITEIHTKEDIDKLIHSMKAICGA